MADFDSQHPIVIEGVKLTKVVGTVKAVTSRVETRFVGTTKSRSRKTIFGEVITEHGRPTTTTDTVRDFWVVSSDDGAETHIETKAPVDVREGHTVLLLRYNDLPAILVSEEMGRWWFLPEVEEALASGFGSHGRVSWKMLLVIFPIGLYFSLLAIAGYWDRGWPLLAGLLGVLTSIGIVYAGPIRLVLHLRAKRRFSRFLDGVRGMLK